MNPIILFREELESENEFKTAQKYFQVEKYRTKLSPNQLVVGRYSVLPFYKELEQELKLNNNFLINSYQEHCFAANIESWATENTPLSGMTPKTWSDWHSLPEGSYVLKGKTNSRKQRWSTHMYAKTLSDVPVIASRLWDDTLISDQGLVIREYIPLKKIGEGLNDMPIVNEHRTFWLAIEISGKRIPVLLSKGFYWMGSHPELEHLSKFEGYDVAFEAANKIAEYITFFVLDLAETESGEWIVIEVNDGQMSGVSGCDIDELYSNLSMYLKR
jgi:hypothetical protein